MGGGSYLLIAICLAGVFRPYLVKFQRTEISYFWSISLGFNAPEWFGV